MNDRHAQSIVFDAQLFLQPRLIRHREYNMSKHWSSAIASFYILHSVHCITVKLLQFEPTNAHSFTLKSQCHNTTAATCFGPQWPSSGGAELYKRVA